MNSIIQDFLLLYSSNPIGQSIGVLGFFVSLYAFLHKEDKKFYIIIVIANFLWMLHFYVVGLLVAALVSFINLARNLSALYFKKQIGIIVFFILVYIGIGWYFSTNFMQFLPILGGIFSTLGVLCFSGIVGRIVLLGGSFCWVVYAYLGGSIGGMLSETMIIIISTTTIIRLLIDKYTIGQKKYLSSEVE